MFYFLALGGKRMDVFINVFLSFLEHNVAEGYTAVSSPVHALWAYGTVEPPAGRHLWD